MDPVSTPPKTRRDVIHRRLMIKIQSALRYYFYKKNYLINLKFHILFLVTVYGLLATEGQNSVDFHAR